jgi:hypothetical protein
LSLGLGGLTIVVTAQWLEPRLMSAANIRLANKESSLTNVAKKVLEAIPIRDAWTIQQVYQELARQQHTIEARIIGGCIDDLTERGLIRQPQTGRFQRVAYKEDTGQAPKVDRTIVAISEGVNDARHMTEINDPLTSLARLADRLRTMAGEIDDAALAMAQQVQEAKEGTEKLQQLQALLKSIGGA